MQGASTKDIFKTGTRSVSALDHARIRRTPIAWPDAARVAVTCTVIFEMFTGSSGEAKRALYGGRRGVWRLLDLMDAHSVKASFLVSGYAAECFPSAVEEIHRRGHEIAGFGYATNRVLETLPPEQEREDILKTLSILEKITGSQPKGWVSPELRPGDRTLEVLAEAGVLWNGDFPNDDVPYVVRVGGKSLVIIPFTKESDDAEIYGKNGHPPSVWTECFTDSLDVLYEEGRTHPKMLNFSVRTHLFGHTVGVQPLNAAIRHAKSRPNIWITTRTEIAQWWQKQNYM